jgi:hypothetical protein
MIRTEQIPDEVVEAAAIDLHRSIWGNDCYSWAKIDGKTRERFRQHARATIAAALDVWPEARHSIERNGSYPVLILPLPKDAADD